MGLLPYWSEKYGPKTHDRWKNQKFTPSLIVLVPQEIVELKNVNFYVFLVANDLLSTCRKFEMASLKEYIFLKE